MSGVVKKTRKYKKKTPSKAIKPKLVGCIDPYDFDQSTPLDTTVPGDNADIAVVAVSVKPKVAVGSVKGKCRTPELAAMTPAEREERRKVLNRAAAKGWRDKKAAAALADKEATEASILAYKKDIDKLNSENFSLQSQITYLERDNQLLTTSNQQSFDYVGPLIQKLTSENLELRSKCRSSQLEAQLLSESSNLLYKPIEVERDKLKQAYDELEVKYWHLKSLCDIANEEKNNFQLTIEGLQSDLENFRFEFDRLLGVNSCYIAEKQAFEIKNNELFLLNQSLNNELGELRNIVNSVNYGTN